MEGKVKAWLIPAEGNGAWIPVGGKTRRIGFSASRCDIVLTSIASAAVEAEIYWSNGELYIKSFVENGISELNGTGLAATAEPVYQDDEITFVRESYKVFRTDGKKRPAREYTVRFVCDGEEIETVTLKKGEPAKFPYMPEKREEDKDLYKFAGWTDEKGSPVPQDFTSNCDVTVKAVYKPEREGTMASRGLMNLKSYNVIYSEAPVHIGGTKQCHICVGGVKGTVAKLHMLNGKLEVFASGSITVNDTPVGKGETVTVYDDDILKIGSRSYKVCRINKKKPDGVKAGLTVVNGSLIELPLFKEGSSVTIGREQQEKLHEFRIIGRKHAVISYNKGQFTIRDIGSKNGTYLVSKDGEETRLEPETEYPIQSGDQIRLALIDFIFNVE